MFRHLIAAAVFTLVPVAGGAAKADPAIYKQTTPAVAWVNTTEDGDKYQATAWVVDKGNRLLVTNFHVAGKADSIELFFPVVLDGKLVTDRAWYKKNVRPVRAKLVLGAAQKDLAVIQAERLPDDVEELALAGTGPKVGDTVYTVGHPGNRSNLWNPATSTVAEVGTAKVTIEGNTFNGRLSISRLPISQGASGSPVLNVKGEVVGVVFAGNPNAKEPIVGSVDVSEVRTLLTTAKAKLAATENAKPQHAKPRLAA